MLMLNVDKLLVFQTALYRIESKHDLLYFSMMIIQSILRYHILDRYFQPALHLTSWHAELRRSCVPLHAIISTFYTAVHL